MGPRRIDVLGFSDSFIQTFHLAWRLRAAVIAEDNFL